MASTHVSPTVSEHNRQNVRLAEGKVTGMVSNVVIKIRGTDMTSIKTAASLNWVVNR